MIDFFYFFLKNYIMSRFSTLILCIGIPGAGKTTWVYNYKRIHPLTYVISTDDIRKELTGEEQCVDPSQNDMIHNEARNRAKKILDDPSSVGGFGPEIIIDSTNCSAEEWLAYKKLRPSLMRAIVFDCEPLKALENQKYRERQVPLEILEMKYTQLQENIPYLEMFFNCVDHVK